MDQHTKQEPPTIKGYLIKVSKHCAFEYVTLPGDQRTVAVYGDADQAMADFVIFLKAGYCPRLVPTTHMEPNIGQKTE